MEAITIGRLGKTTVCIGTKGVTKATEYPTGFCTLWVFWIWGKQEVDEG